MKLKVGEKIVIQVHITDEFPMESMSVAASVDGYGDYIELSDTTLEEALEAAKVVLEKVRKDAQTGKLKAYKKELKARRARING